MLHNFPSLRSFTIGQTPNIWETVLLGSKAVLAKLINHNYL